jgi:CelD/BcsL family acetyltransferase involved in cellulose biosynthesis
MASFPTHSTTNTRLSLGAHTRLDDARGDWDALFACAPVSAYQAYGFCRDWFETIGHARGVAPLIVVARDDDQRPVALLPLALRRVGSLRVAEFLGGKESNLGLGLFRRDQIGAFDVPSLLKAAARETGVDLFVLRNQPATFDGVVNPLALPGSPPSASFTYGTRLPSTQEALAARFSADARKKLRKKQTRLEKLGALVFERATTAARAADIASALLTQKAARLPDAEMDGAPMRDFLSRLCATLGDDALELHALTLDGRIIAAYAGLARGGRFSALLNSFETEEEIARSSPGDLLLHALLRDLVARGFTHFDLGIGEARYKNAVCEDTIALVDTVFAASALGALAAPVFIALARAKRWIKQSPRLLAAASRLRRMLRG